MKLVLAQMTMKNDLDDNYQRTCEIMKQAQGADLLFFPEIQFSPFFPQYQRKDSPYNVSRYEMTIEHPYITEMCKLTKEYELYCSPNLYLHKEDGNFDASLWITPDGIIDGISTMVHVLQAENFYEEDYYMPSKDGFHVYDTPFGKIGIVICYDRHLPESIRTCSLLGAQLIIIPTANLKSEPMEMFEWEVRVQAMQNNVFIAMCNRTGCEGDLEFAGESIVVNPEGNVIAKADDGEQLLQVSIDLEATNESRKKRPYIATRRPEWYA